MTTTERIVEAIKKECPAICNMGDFEPLITTAIESVIDKDIPISFPEIEISEFDEPEKHFIAVMKGTGIVVQGNSKEESIEELIKSIRVKILYDLTPKTDTTDGE